MHQNIPSLTGLRFVAAITVVVSHTLLWTVKVSQPPPLLAFAWSLSAFGMTLFFVLAGEASYSIYLSYLLVITAFAHGSEVTHWRRAIGVSLQVAIRHYYRIVAGALVLDRNAGKAGRAAIAYHTIPDRAASKVAVTVVRSISARTPYRVKTEAGTRAKQKYQLYSRA